MTAEPDVIVSKSRNIKVVVLDVDGVLTDGTLTYSDSGDEIKSFNVKDGLGIYLLRQAGIRTAILTARGSSIVKKRAKELKIDKVYKNFHFKLKAFKKICHDFKVQPEEICFIGDDLIDIPVINRVGLAVCPADAVEDVKRRVHVVTDKKGGRGAVREVCDLILQSQDKWSEVTDVYFGA